MNPSSAITLQKNQYEIYHETKAHTSAEFPYNTYLCTIPLDFPFVTVHWHEEVELIVIKKGCGTVSVNLISTEVTAGDIVLVLPGYLHSIEQKESFSMEYENILFKPSLLKSAQLDLCDRDFLQPLFGGLTDIPFHLSANHPLYQEMNLCIARIDELCSKRPDGYQLGVKGLLFQLFFMMLSGHAKKQFDPKNKKFLDKIKLVLSYIQENYSRAISVEEISAVCFYSQSHFMKFFKDSMGMSFTRYLNDYRLQVAARLLKVSDDNILNIASSVGFDNLSYFNRAFKKKYHVSPGSFRKNES